MSNKLAKRTSEELVSLAVEIREEHEACEHDAQSAVERAINCGRMLLEAKEKAGHGNWKSWIAENFPASYRTAAGYMRLAGASKVQDLAHLGIEKALAELAEPKDAGRTVGNGEKGTRQTKALPTSNDPTFRCLCGEQFDQKVWHCEQCGHHWLPDSDYCNNCCAENPNGAEEVDAEVVDEEPVRPRPRKTVSDGPAHYLPELAADDVEENLRAQALLWFERGLVIKELLDKKRSLEPRDGDDRKAIKKRAALMESTARRLKESL